ncbi:probable serine/threonine-protein kinase DDB_G0283337 [Polyergus mexicanus]|uniref:probable serine/threonine-protein kinase DDB_G0283337 n=1 Tax=Polyergus mexicanus TaxID=615972 RepID=UPI0038B5E0FF
MKIHKIKKLNSSNIYLQPASCSKIKEKGFTNNLDSSTSNGNQKHILNVNVMSNNPIYQHLSNANTNLKSIPDSDIMQSDTVQNLVRKQSLLCSENLNSNNSIDSVKIPTCEDSISKNIVKQKISINNSKKKNLTVLVKVKSKLNLYKQSYENKQRTVPQVNSAKVSNSFEETNFIQFEETPKNSLFDELSPAVSNSDSSDAIRSESNFIKSKKECRKVVSSDKQISVNTSIGSNSDSSDGIRSEADFINNKKCKKIISSNKQISIKASIGAVMYNKEENCDINKIKKLAKIGLSKLQIGSRKL